MVDPGQRDFGNYEFTDEQNTQIQSLARYMIVSGVFSIIFSFHGLFMASKGNGSYVGPMVTLLIAVLTLGAAASFKQITKTSGNDIGHLMEAMHKLKTIYLIAFIGSICKGDANVRTFMPFNASSVGAGRLVSTTVGLL